MGEIHSDDDGCWLYDEESTVCVPLPLILNGMNRTEQNRTVHRRIELLSSTFKTVLCGVSARLKQWSELYSTVQYSSSPALKHYMRTWLNDSGYVAREIRQVVILPSTSFTRFCGTLLTVHCRSSLLELRVLMFLLHKLPVSNHDFRNALQCLRLDGRVRVSYHLKSYFLACGVGNRWRAEGREGRSEKKKISERE